MGRIYGTVWPPLPDKPPRMPWRTYNRICERINAPKARADDVLIASIDNKLCLHYH